jgi:hypothetical protein
MRANPRNDRTEAMKHSESHGWGSALAVFGASMVMMLALGCTSAPPPAPLPDESQLLTAGFKVVEAKTKLQQEYLQNIPRDRVSEWQRTGKSFFIYPVVAKNQLYVGTQKEYDAYCKVAPRCGSPLAQQHAADMASYNKQDAGMQANTNRDLSDPYYFWGFDALGW